MSYYLNPSGKLPTQNGKLVLITQAEFEACCCDFCAEGDLAEPSATQEQARAVELTDCYSEFGSFDDWYDYDGVTSGVHKWSGTASAGSDCNGDGYAEYRPVEITLECVNGYWSLAAQWEDCNFTFAGVTEESTIYVDANGKFAGSDTVDMLSIDDSVWCTWTITFGGP